MLYFIILIAVYKSVIFEIVPIKSFEDRKFVYYYVILNVNN